MNGLSVSAAFSAGDELPGRVGSTSAICVGQLAFPMDNRFVGHHKGHIPKQRSKQVTAVSPSLCLLLDLRSDDILWRIGGGS